MSESGYGTFCLLQQPLCQIKTYYQYKVSSLGKDWHRPCLKCEKCNKTLSGGHIGPHEGKPYCNNPCYSALFGPKGDGRGQATVSSVY
uniref:Cysteine-rich protein 1 n=1 Tax=Astyanax mexicanus TaxID=7994 RepID=A0A8B9L470_ASTMX